MKKERLICGILQSNCYIVYQEDGGACYVIDPGYGARKIIKLIEKHDLSVRGILLTHNHYDHVGAVDKLVAVYDCPVYMHREDCDMYGKHVDIYMEDEDIIDLEGESIRVISTPGHTKGSVCFYSEKNRLAFTGDTVFNVDLGRTDLAGGSEADMKQSIRLLDRLWANDVMIYPGHGDGCTMKTVREINSEFIAMAANEGQGQED